MNNAMSDDINICGLSDDLGFPTPQRFEHWLDRVREFFGWQFLRDGLTIGCDLEFGHTFFRRPTGICCPQRCGGSARWMVDDFVQTTFLGARASVKDEYFHCLSIILFYHVYRKRV